MYPRFPVVAADGRFDIAHSHTHLVAMKNITLDIDKDLLAKARQYADEHETTLEALIAEHLAVLADRAGRRLTVREQTYVDCAPSEEVKEQLRAAFQRERAWRQKAD
jgi:hypothetical protein